MTEKDFIHIVKNTLTEVVKAVVKDELNKRIPPGTRFYRVVDDVGHTVGYTPYVDTDLVEADKR